MIGRRPVDPWNPCRVHAVHTRAIFAVQSLHKVVSRVAKPPSDFQNAANMAGLHERKQQKRLVILDRPHHSLVDALFADVHHRLEVRAHITRAWRNDTTARPASGTASSIRCGRVMHHCTLHGCALHYRQLCCRSLRYRRVLRCCDRSAPMNLFFTPESSPCSVGPHGSLCESSVNWHCESDRCTPHALLLGCVDALGP